MKTVVHWSLLGSLLLLACGEEDGTAQAAKPIDFDIPNCDKYALEPDVKGFCHTIWIAQSETLQEMEENCSKAGDWQSDCRASWLAVQMESNWGAEKSHSELLKICGDSESCALTVLQMRTDPDIEIQLQLCDQYTGDQAATCVQHSLQRWWRGGTDADERSTLKQVESRFVEEVGWWIAAIGICDDQVTQPCDGAQPAVLATCTAAAAELNSHEDQCSQMERSWTPTPSQPLNGSQGHGESGAQATTNHDLPPSAHNPSHPKPGDAHHGTGMPSPDSRTHGHVPDGTPGGGPHRPPDQSGPQYPSPP